MLKLRVNQNVMIVKAGKLHDTGRLIEELISGEEMCDIFVKSRALNGQLVLFGFDSLENGWRCWFDAPCSLWPAHYRESTALYLIEGIN